MPRPDPVRAWPFRPGARLANLVLEEELDACDVREEFEYGILVFVGVGEKGAVPRAVGYGLQWFSSVSLKNRVSLKRED